MGLNRYNDGKKNNLPCQSVANKPVQRKITSANLIDNRSKTIQQKSNNTGLPDQLKSGIESLSGHSMDDVKVHYNSSKPAQLSAHAFAQGNQIHLGSGQEKHLPHEAWHVVQQKEGRVKANNSIQTKSKVSINDDVGLEREADLMGAKALQMKTNKGNSEKSLNAASIKSSSLNPIQRRTVGFEFQASNAKFFTKEGEPIGQSKHVIADHGAYTVEMDAHDLELVSKEINIDQGLGQLVKVLTEIQDYVKHVESQAGPGPELKGNFEDYVHVFPMVDGSQPIDLRYSGSKIKLMPQATFGVKLEEVRSMVFAFAKDEKWWGTGGSSIYKKGNKDAIVSSTKEMADAPEIKGLVAIILGILHISKGFYARFAAHTKDLAPLMPRTSFRQMWKVIEQRHPSFNSLELKSIIEQKGFKLSAKLWSSGAVSKPYMKSRLKNYTVGDLLDQICSGQKTTLEQEAGSAASFGSLEEQNPDGLSKYGMKHPMDIGNEEHGIYVEHRALGEMEEGDIVNLGEFVANILEDVMAHERSGGELDFGSVDRNIKDAEVMIKRLEDRISKRHDEPKTLETIGVARTELAQAASAAEHHSFADVHKSLDEANDMIAKIGQHRAK